MAVEIEDRSNWPTTREIWEYGMAHPKPKKLDWWSNQHKPSHNPVFVYLFKHPDAEKYKIGYSDNTMRRASQLSIPGVFELLILAEIRCVNKDQARGLEKAMHDYFEPLLISPEWFALGEDDVKWFVEFAEAWNDRNTL